MPQIKQRAELDHHCLVFMYPPPGHARDLPCQPFRRLETRLLIYKNFALPTASVMAIRASHQPEVSTNPTAH